jgi:hypothetical protein
MSDHVVSCAGSTETWLSALKGRCQSWFLSLLGLRNYLWLAESFPACSLTLRLEQRCGSTQDVEHLETLSNDTQT